MAGIEARDIGYYRSVRWRAGRVHPVDAQMDILIVGMPEQSCPPPPNPPACHLDAALFGTLSQLRAGGVFDGRFGETLILSRPPAPVRSGSLLIVGMGDADGLTPDRMGMLASTAMHTILRLDGRSIGCLLGLMDAAATPDSICDTARAMMTGLLQTLDTCPEDSETVEREWICDLRTAYADRTGAALEATIRQWRAAVQSPAIAHGHQSGKAPI